MTVESKTPYEYKITFDPHRAARTFWFSPTEIKHLVISALLVMAVGLSIVFLYFDSVFLSNHVEILIVSSLIFVLSFV
ncbi:MAG: hypothetical protein PVF15_11230, partial [Candidatus Bathyarchaeota archaeon]